MSSLNNQWFFRCATQKDLPILSSLLKQAKNYMRAEGNTTQWASLSAEDAFSEGIQKRQCFLIVDPMNTALGAFLLVPSPEPTYATIEGQWPDDAPYVTLHRVISSGKQAKIFDAICAYAFSQCDRVRIDTHADNQTMQRAISRNGFHYCGIIRVEDGSPRLAFAGYRSNS